MNYKLVTLWIFILLLLLIVLLYLYPSSWLIGICLVAFPVLLIIQVVVILRSGEESKNKFNDKRYEDE